MCEAASGALSAIVTPLLQGRGAYAAKQAYVWHKLKDKFAKLWGKSLQLDNVGGYGDKDDMSDVLKYLDSSGGDCSSEDD